MRSAKTTPFETSHCSKSAMSFALASFVLPSTGRPSSKFTPFRSSARRKSPVVLERPPTVPGADATCHGKKAKKISHRNLPRLRLAASPEVRGPQQTNHNHNRQNKVRTLPLQLGIAVLRKMGRSKGQPKQMMKRQSKRIMIELKPGVRLQNPRRTRSQMAPFFQTGPSPGKPNVLSNSRGRNSWSIPFAKG